MRFLTAWLTLLGCTLAPALAESVTASTYSVGVAQVNITPSYPVRLSGFNLPNRREECSSVLHPIWAKALAIGAKEPLVLIAVDTCGIPARMTQAVAERLHKAGVARERLAITSTHTHTAPMLAGVLPTLFGEPIPKEHLEHIDRYTAELTDRLENVALAALADRKPATLHWGIGKVGFAVNRRTKSVPVDHDLPLLAVRDPNGKLRAVYVNYACHCVTLSHNKIGGDWAGFAQRLIQEEHAGVIALVSVGCGADQNPNSGVTGDKVEVARRQGTEIAAEVRRLLGGYLAPVRGDITAKASALALPLAAPPKADWDERAKSTDPRGYHARVQLERLARGEPLKAQIDYSVQAWAFGDSLAMVFLPGEVVVDYAMRLKRELDGLRLWVNAYSNDVPCYIPSERVLKEGGYEGGGAMTYYDLPGPFQPGLEEKIVAAVHAQIGDRFKAPHDPKRLGGSKPLSPQQSLAELRTHQELAVDLVLAEPMVIDPVAIDFGPDGKLWVAEMVDYPAGFRGDYQPGGRVRMLEDTDGDSRFDKATVFLDGIPFPTGLTVWRKGVLVCAAPDILYAEDTDGDGKADVVRKLYSGFGTHNYQARVNSLEYGLDGWVYGACGSFGGSIQSFAGGSPTRLGNRDFRIRPDTGVLEPASGRTQQGRVRDDWDNWFGCDNLILCWHYPLADHYLRRNPHVAPSTTSVFVPDGPNPNRLFPLTQLQLFKLSGPPGKPTAVCGLGVYRDDLLGKEYRGNVFACEPVDLLVHRLQLSPKGSTFAGKRAANETASEFLASADNWFRPVQARTGPDGALWIVDMYRFVIEHPRWIPPEDLAKLDVRAGSTLGRIYRVRPREQPLRPWRHLDKLNTEELVAALDSPNGWQRDMAQQMLLWRGDKLAGPALEKLAAHCARPEARLHALCSLDGLGLLRADVVRARLADVHPGVRRHAVRLAESFLPQAQELGEDLFKLLGDANAQVRLQLAYSLGAGKDPRAGHALAKLALAHPDDDFLSAAVLSSMNRDNLGAVLATVLAGNFRSPSATFVGKLVGLAPAFDAKEELTRAVRDITRDFYRRSPWAGSASYDNWQFTGVAGVLDALERRGQSLEKWLSEAEIANIRALAAEARTTAVDEKATESRRLAALQVLGRENGAAHEDQKIIVALLTPQNSSAIQAAAIAALGRMTADTVAATLIAGWKSYTPALQSQVLDVLLSRESWKARLLQSIDKKEVPAAQIDARRRELLLRQRNMALRELAERLFSDAASVDRRKVLDDYRDITTLRGDAAHGKEVFAKRCSTCHRLNDVGTDVGPELAALANKTPQFLLQEVLDPNRNVDGKYLEYFAATKAGQTFTGILTSESASAITLRGQEGKEQTLLRNDLDELKSTGKSLMPEGLEKDISKQDMADLFAYLGGGAEVPAALAKQILDPGKSDKERRDLIEKNAAQATELVAALVADLQPDAPEEYVRIPWIWRAAITAGKANDTAQLRRLLDVSLPKAGAPLRDWQAVVIGGGVINGISLQGIWPKPRVLDILQAEMELAQRWQAALPQAAAMADNEKIKTGTRYDALRMLALDDWELRREQLAKYLAKGTHAELQMGAISGLADVERPEVAALLLGGIDHYPATNRKLALDALLRGDARVAALLDAIEQGIVKAAWLTEEQKKLLRALKDEKLRRRATQLLAQP